MDGLVEETFSKEEPKVKVLRRKKVDPNQLTLFDKFEK